MRITAKIAENLGGLPERWLGVDDPLLPEKRIDKSGEAFRVCKLGDGAGKSQLVFAEGLSQSVNELGPEHGTQHVHRQEEGVFRANPTLVVGSEPACRNHAVDMRMQK